MKTNQLPSHRFLGISILTLLLMVAAPVHSFALSGWGSSYTSGKSRARSASKPLVVVIAKEGCPACAELEANLARNGKALKSAVRVRVEADRNPGIASAYAAAGTPTLLVFSADNGYAAPIYSYTGVMGSSELRQLGRSLDVLARRK